MNNIKEYINFLIQKYDLKKLYYKFILLSLINSICRESYYWILIYFSVKIQNDSSKITNLAIILLILLSINIPSEKYASLVKCDFIKEIKIANNKYFMDNIINTSKSIQINIDMDQYYNTLNTLNENLEKYIINIKIKTEIPVCLITIIVVFLSNPSILSTDNIKINIIIILTLFIIFIYTIIFINKQHLYKQNKLDEENILYESNIRNYIINGKDLLINNNFNNDYIIKQNNFYCNTGMEIDKLQVKYNIYSKMIVFAIVLTLILSYFNKLNAENFLSYFIIIYDIETIVQMLDTYYQNKFMYNKMEIKLKNLHKLFKDGKHNNVNHMLNNTIIIDKIVISSLYNITPFLESKNEIIIYMTDHILVDGLSGSGKTSILYFLKGIINIEQYNIEPSLHVINDRCFITLPNYKNLYSGRLYDIISNYSDKPNVEMIHTALNLANIKKYNDNKLLNELMIDIETVSAGEYTRLLIARTIYTIKLKNYDILLFDEIDTNLNDEMAILLCKTLLDIFSDNIILYITHNNNVKKLFTKKIFVDSGHITYNLKD